MFPRLTLVTVQTPVWRVSLGLGPASGLGRFSTRLSSCFCLLCDIIAWYKHCKLVPHDEYFAAVVAGEVQYCVVAV